MIGARPLANSLPPFFYFAGLGMIPLNGYGPLYHQNIWYDDGGNSGFFDTDDIRPDRGHSRSEYNFSRDPKHYDDCLMKQAEKNVQQHWDYDWRMPWYKPWGWNNCQDYCDAVRAEYQRLESLQHRP